MMIKQNCAKCLLTGSGLAFQRLGDAGDSLVEGNVQGRGKSVHRGSFLLWRELGRQTQTGGGDQGLARGAAAARYS